MESKDALFIYCTRIGDDSLILGHRLSEWCGHGPILEEDIALINVSLDLIGQARIILDFAGQVEGKGRDEDSLAYHRAEKFFRNHLLCEQPNGDFGQTVVRQFFFDAYHYYFLKELCQSSDSRLKNYALKSIKEVSYHLHHSSSWVLRLGDGTEESHNRVQKSVDYLWQYTGELFEMNEVDKILLKNNIAVNLLLVKELWHNKVSTLLAEATLQMPTDVWSQTGSQKGIHSEHLGHILTELQYLPRVYPDATW